MHYKTIRVEGFDLHRLLTLCLKERIALSNIRIRGDLEMTMRLAATDWQRFLKLTGNRYRITVMAEKGVKPLLKRVFRKKSILIGVALFVLLVYYQSCFVSEIRVYGFERLTEREIRENLKLAGLYEGCSKSIDLNQVEIKMFRQIADISWIGITLKGNLAEVTVIEGTEPITAVDVNQPCHIVATKEGYIVKSIAREGKELVTQGDFVNVGDVLISGILPIEDKTYRQDPGKATERYVHAKGEVYAKIVYRYTYYQEKEELKKEKTGKNIPGFSLTIGNFTFNTARIFWPYDSAIYEERLVFDFLRPIPIRFGINRQSEVELSKQLRSQQSIEKRGKQQIREAMKENIPESAQILNKSLKFYAEENIMMVIIMIDALEEIGEEQTFIPADKGKPVEAPEEGTVPIGESTD